MPANVCVSDRAIVTAGLANDVLAVNQYAAKIHAAINAGNADGRWRAPSRIVSNNPNVATPSLSHWPPPVRRRVPGCSSGRSNIAWARSTPRIAATSWTQTKASAVRVSIAPRSRIASVTAGLKCAPDTGPSTTISTYNTAAVAPAFASNATPSFPSDNATPMIPEPTTVASNTQVPSASASNARDNVVTP